MAWRIELTTECCILLQDGPSPFNQVIHKDRTQVFVSHLGPT